MTTDNQPAEAGVEAEPIVAVAPSNAESEATTEPKSDESNVDADKQGNESQEEVFPKKAVNAISRRDKQIGKLRAEKYQVLNEVEQLRQQLNQYQQKPNNSSPASDAPDINQFANYDEYNRAVAKYEARKTYAEESQKTQQSQSQSNRRAWEEERDNHIDENAVKVKEVFSDFDHVVQENIDLLSNIAPHVKEAIRESDNGAFALYNLAKDGVLEQLNGMSPAKVAMMVARAEDKALGMSKTKQSTKAPAPLQSVKGTAPSRPQLLDQLGNDPDKILAWLKSR